MATPLRRRLRTYRKDACRNFTSRQIGGRRAQRETPKLKGGEEVKTVLLLRHRLSTQWRQQMDALTNAGIVQGIRKCAKIPDAQGSGVLVATIRGTKPLSTATLVVDLGRNVLVDLYPRQCTSRCVDIVAGGYTTCYIVEPATKCVSDMLEYDFVGASTSMRAAISEYAGSRATSAGAPAMTATNADTHAIRGATSADRMPTCADARMKTSADARMETSAGARVETSATDGCMSNGCIDDSNTAGTPFCHIKSLASRGSLRRGDPFEGLVSGIGDHPDLVYKITKKAAPGHSPVTKTTFWKIVAGTVGPYVGERPLQKFINHKNYECSECKQSYSVDLYLNPHWRTNVVASFHHSRMSTRTSGDILFLLQFFAYMGV